MGRTRRLTSLREWTKQRWRKLCASEKRGVVHRSSKWSVQPMFQLLHLVALPCCLCCCFIFQRGWGAEYARMHTHTHAHMVTASGWGFARRGHQSPGECSLCVQTQPRDNRRRSAPHLCPLWQNPQRACTVLSAFVCLCVCVCVCVCVSTFCCGATVCGLC